MSMDIKIPEIGESISEVVISEWLKAEGDYVAKDEDIVVVESDKATVTIPAPKSGMVSKILKQNGGTAAVGEAIGRLEEEDSAEHTEDAQVIDAAQTNELDTDGSNPGETGTREVDNRAGQTRSKKSAARRANRTEKKAGIEAETVETRETEPPAQETPDEVDTAVGSTEIDHPHSDREGSTPESPEKITATGAANKPIKQTDEPADKHSDTLEAQQTEPRPEPTLSEGTSDDSTRIGSEDRKVDIKGTVSLPERPNGRRETVVPMSAIRRRIAERLVRAQQETAFLSTFNEIDMSTVHSTRQRYQEIFQKRHGIKLGFMPFFVKAAIEALQLIPQVNAEIRNTDIVYRNYYDIGVAVGGGKGLVVPILRNAENMSFAEIEQAIQSFARKAENRQLKPNDLAGGTFTISNGGIYGSLLSTPIINSPQSAVLGMHAIEDRPVVRDGQVVVRPMMYVALTYDHRIIDGREAVTFLKRIKDCVETPARILLQV